MPLKPEEIDATAPKPMAPGLRPEEIEAPPVPSGTELTPAQIPRLVRKFRGTGEAKLAELHGYEPDIDYKVGAPFHIMTDFETADNPAEAKAILASHYGAENIGQDKKGRWWFKDPSTGKKTAIQPSFLSGAAATAPSTALAIGGAVAGAPLGPAGMIGGAALGGAAGKGITEFEKFIRGLTSKTPEEEAFALGKEAAIQGGLSALPVVGRAVGTKAMEGIRSFGLGVKPESQARGLNLIERGGIPPVSQIATEATGLGKKQDIAARVSYGGKFGDYEKNLRLVESDMRRSMQNAGIPADEIDEFMRNVATKNQAVSMSESGHSIVAAAQARVAAMNEAVENDLSAARSALDTAQTRFRDYAARRSGALGQEAARGIEAERAAFSRAMTQAYQRVHDMTEGERVVEMRPAIQEAQNIVAEMGANPNAVPPVIRNLAGGERAIPIGPARTEPVFDPATGGIIDRPVARPREWQDFESIEAAHGLRNTLRQEMRRRSLTLTPEQQFAMLSRVENALDDSFTALAQGLGPHGNTLAREAATALRTTDELYREGIAQFKNARVNRLVNDARDGIFADPSTVATEILVPGQVEQARTILNMMPQQTRESVAQAYMGNILSKVSEVDPFTGRNIVNGGRLLSFMNDPQNRGLLELVFSRDFLADLHGLGTEYAALKGNLDLAAVRPGAVRDMLARSNAAQREAEAFAREDPVGMLASNDPRKIDAAVREISRPGAEAVTEQAANTLNVDSPAWRQLQQDNLKLMFSDLFKENETSSVLVSGAPLRDRMSQYTARQRELLFANGLGDDILELSKNISMLFPRSLVAGGTRMQSGLIAGKIQSRSYFDPRALFPRWYFATWDYLLRRPTVLRWIAGQTRILGPKGDYVKSVMGATGRMIFNSIAAGPGVAEGQPPAATAAAPAPPPVTRFDAMGNTIQ